MNEDEITKYLIEDRTKTHPDSDIDIEVPYNNYGDRGSVDFVAQLSSDKIEIIEVKSESAIEEATGANEILRQFNRHREHFFEGSEISKSKTVRFYLIFAATPNVARHVAENADLYKQAMESDLYGNDAMSVSSILQFIHPDQGREPPLRVFSKDIDFRDDPNFEDRLEHAPTIKEAIGDVLEEYRG